ncbi:LrgB family protein [Methylobacterium dankookense]|uniref:Inner membrane protein YohK n=1 Tax=Methylobacterium dankookense TaxID=560405 RepID=A0A564G2Q9_9HYPH|nr:LrgB family protein [Methylobacterium dankookense]GJD55465.1 Inner membrane protein YohK [Methylobacterium dankookense]VUF14789.1 Inner membrane protein YohK [Methylobacterium dankookense]
MTGDFALWVYLSRTPLLWLTVTLVAYLVADRISAATGRHPVANPVLIAIAITASVLAFTETPYPTYFAGAQFVHFLLGPATVVLALPLYEHRATVVRAFLPMLAALAAGCTAALVTAIGTARLLGIPEPVIVSLSPKSVTSGVAMGISEALGGDPTLTAVLVMTTGIVGAILVTPLMQVMGIRDMRARGFAAGLAAHGVGTARAFQVSEVAGTFAGIAMGLNAFLTAIVVPLALHLLS